MGDASSQASSQCVGLNEGVAVPGSVGSLRSVGGVGGGHRSSEQAEGAERVPAAVAHSLDACGARQRGVGQAAQRGEAARRSPAGGPERGRERGGCRRKPLHVSSRVCNGHGSGIP
eukprot:1723292-Rhodomonas_salina.1